MTSQQALTQTYYLEDAIDLLASTYQTDNRKDRKETKEAYEQLVDKDRERCGFRRWIKL